VKRDGVGAFRLHRLQDTGYTGWWKHDTGFVTIHVLDAAKLASDGTWSLLRFAANPPGDPDQDLAAESNADPRLSIEEARRISEAIMNHVIENVAHHEARTASQIVFEQGREEGREEGREDGALALLLPIALAVLTPAEIAALGVAPSSQVLRAALTGRIPGL